MAKREAKKVDPNIQKLVDIRKIMDNGHRATVNSADSTHLILALNDAYCAAWGMTANDRLGHGRYLAQKYLPNIEEAVAHLMTEGGYGAGTTLINKQVEKALGIKDGFYMDRVIAAASDYKGKHKGLTLEEAVGRVSREVDDVIYGPVRDYLERLDKEREAKGLEYYI